MIKYYVVIKFKICDIISFILCRLNIFFVRKFHSLKVLPKTQQLVLLSTRSAIRIMKSETSWCKKMKKIIYSEWLVPSISTMFMVIYDGYPVNITTTVIGYKYFNPYDSILKHLTRHIESKRRLTIYQRRFIRRLSTSLCRRSIEKQGRSRSSSSLVYEAQVIDRYVMSLSM